MYPSVADSLPGFFSSFFEYKGTVRASEVSTYSYITTLYCYGLWLLEFSPVQIIIYIVKESFTQDGVVRFCE